MLNFKKILSKWKKNQKISWNQIFANSFDLVMVFSFYNHFEWLHIIQGGLGEIIGQLVLISSYWLIFYLLHIRTLGEFIFRVQK